MDLNLLWFLLIGVLIAGYAVLDGFDLGVGVISLFVPEGHRRTCVASIAPTWDGNEVWLITAGASLLAAFPPVYAGVFSGFYVAFLLLLLALIARAVSIEFSGTAITSWSRRAWALGFGLGSLVPAVLLGVAVGNIVRGVPIDANGDFVGTFWGLLNPYALLFGLLGLAMFLTHGAVYLALKTTGDLHSLAAKVARRGVYAWVVLYLGTTVATAMAAPSLFWQSLSRPVSWFVAAVLVGGLGLAMVWVRAAAWGRAFLGTAIAIVASVGLVGATLFPLLVPSSVDPAFSLDIYRHSSSPKTLMTMAIIVAIGMPFVIGYTIWVYRVFRGKVQGGGY